MKQSIIKLILSLLLSWLFAHSYAQDNLQNLASDVSNLIEPFSSKDLFSGAIMIAEGETILYQGAFGFANREHIIPNEVNTRFGLGSITKLFTGIIVQQLVAEGKLDLNAPIEKYIEGFPRGPKKSIPKIDHLVNHRSGIPHRVTNEEEEMELLDTQDIVEKVKDAGLSFKPGKKRLYSSAGYTVLARVIEIVEEMTFDQIVEKRIFSPANMATAVNESKDNPISERADSYFLATNNRSINLVEAPKKNLGFLTGAASSYASLKDLLKFKLALENGVYGKDFWKKYLDPNSSIWKGWSGRTNGYWSYLDVLPSSSFTIIILTNVGSAATWKIRSQLRNILLGKEVKDVEFPPEISEFFESPESLVGNYDNNGRVATITFSNERLYRGENEFYPISNKMYYTLGSGSIIRFRRNKSGKVDALVQIRGKNETVMMKME